MIVIDEVDTNESGNPKFHRVTAPSQKALETLLNRVIQRLIRKLAIYSECEDITPGEIFG
ncbi:MAG: hypothetical protein U5O39_12530 [Gammaproteobacteria bacterium]|nr:hypothetical protein [Gammaproteobacteria bacterium]